MWKTAFNHHQMDRPPLVNDGQEFALVIIVGPECCAQKNKQWAFNVLGCFRTAEESHAFARKLNAAGYDAFDMFTVQTRQFLPLPPPPPNELEDVHYPDQLLNTIMTEQRKRIDHSEKSVQKSLCECSERADSHNQAVRKASEEEKKQLRVVLGQPQTTPPPNVDLSKMQKLQL